MLKQWLLVLHRVLQCCYIHWTIVFLGGVEWIRALGRDFKVTELCYGTCSWCSSESQWNRMPDEWRQFKVNDLYKNIMTNKSKYFETRSRWTKLCKHTLPGNSYGFRSFVSWSMILNDIRNWASLGRLRSSSQAGSSCLIYLFWRLVKFAKNWMVLIRNKLN